MNWILTHKGLWDCNCSPLPSILKLNGNSGEACFSGIHTIWRILYVVLLFTYILGIPGFPSTFWWTGVVDLT